MLQIFTEQIALIAPITLGLFALSFVIYQNWKRSKSELKYELRHNVLMTKHPLLFITGKRSLFYFLKYWNQLPEYLASHGYEVYVLPLPWRKEDLRAKSMLNFLNEKSEKNQKFHLFFDSSSYTELSSLFKEQSFDSVASATLVTENLKSTSKMKNIDLRVPQNPKQPELKGLKLAIEEFNVSHKPGSSRDSSSSQTPKLPLTWRLHQNLTFGSTSPELLGWKAELSTYESYLDRAHSLAERDFSG